MAQAGKDASPAGGAVRYARHRPETILLTSSSTSTTPRSPIRWLRAALPYRRMSNASLKTTSNAAASNTVSCNCQNPAVSPLAQAINSLSSKRIQHPIGWDSNQYGVYTSYTQEQLCQSC
jgi:hypothetical protein